MDMSLSKFHEMVKDREVCRRATVHGVAESDTIEWLNNDNAWRISLPCVRHYVKYQEGDIHTLLILIVLTL